MTGEAKAIMRAGVGGRCQVIHQNQALPTMQNQPPAMSHMTGPFTLVAFLSVVLLSGCADPHFFPRLHPLFAGLDESKVPTSSREALNEAKADFRLAKHRQAPRYARYLETTPGTDTKVYAGTGYRIAMVHVDRSYGGRLDGPRILLDRSLTGGDPYSYDEVDESDD